MLSRRAGLSATAWLSCFPNSNWLRTRIMSAPANLKVSKTSMLLRVTRTCLKWTDDELYRFIVDVKLQSGRFSDVSIMAITPPAAWRCSTLHHLSAAHSNDSFLQLQVMLEAAVASRFCPPVSCHHLDAIATPRETLSLQLNSITGANT